MENVVPLGMYALFKNVFSMNREVFLLFINDILELDLDFENIEYSVGGGSTKDLFSNDYNRCFDVRVNIHNKGSVCSKINILGLDDELEKDIEVSDNLNVFIKECKKDKEDGRYYLYNIDLYTYEIGNEEGYSDFDFVCKDGIRVEDKDNILFRHYYMPYYYKSSKRVEKIDKWFSLLMTGNKDEFDSLACELINDYDKECLFYFKKVFLDCQNVVHSYINKIEMIDRMKNDYIYDNGVEMGIKSINEN